MHILLVEHISETKRNFLLGCLWLVSKEYERKLWLLLLLKGVLCPYTINAHKLILATLWLPPNALQIWLIASIEVLNQVVRRFSTDDPG